MTPARSAAARASCAARPNPVAAATSSGVGWEDADATRRAKRSTGRKDVDPRAEQLLEVPGDGKGGSRTRPVALERPRDLEREEGIAVRVLVDASQEGPRPRTAQPSPEHRLERAEAQRPQGDAVQSDPVTAPDPGQGRHARCHPTGARGRARPARLCRRRMANVERGGGRSVEPLHVVHDHQHASRARALAQEGEEGRGDGTSVERGLRLLPEQRDGQGAPLGRGKLRSPSRRTRLRAGPEARRTTASTRDPRVRTGARRSIGSVAASTAASSKVLFPMPAVPSMTRALGHA